MRYLIVVSSLTPGSGLSRYVFSLCALLADKHEIYVVTTHNGNDRSYESEELKHISIKIQLISLGHKSKFGKYLGALRMIRKIEPDFIINNYNGVYQFVLPFIKKKINVVHILHNDTDDFYRIGSINGSRVTGWIAPTMAIADHFNHYTNNKFCDRVSVIPHGVEETSYSEKHNSRIEIVYAGVLYEHKGVKVLPSIIRQLIEAKVDLHFTIIGGGVLSGWLSDQFRYEQDAGIVTMTGVVPHEEVYKIMSKADIFLYPTHLDAFGLVIAEAMMNGAVPVVTLLPGITDNLIEDGKSGYLIAQDNVEAFVNALICLIKDGNRRTEMSKAAYAKSMECFSISSMKKEYIKYFGRFR